MTEITTPADIELARESDREAIAAMWAALFGAHAELGAPPEQRGDPARLPETLRDWVEAAMGDVHQSIFVARMSVGPIGFVAGAIRRADWLLRPKIGGIAALWVDPGFRRAGVGRTLACKALDWFGQHDVSVVDLHASICQPVAQRFWGALGFAPSAVQMRRPISRGDASCGGRTGGGDGHREQQ